MERFDKLPYKNKIMFVTKEYPEYDWAIPIKQFKNRFQCRVTVGFADMKGRRYYETAFDIAEYAVPAMQYVVGAGIINGKTIGTINPEDNATRAEIAVIIHRFIEKTKKI